MAEKKVQSSFMIEPSLKERAERKADEQAISYGELIRKAILLYLGGDLTIEDQIREIKKELSELRGIKKELAEIREIKKELGATLRRILGPEADEIHASLWNGVEKRFAEAKHNQKEIDIEEEEWEQ